MKPRDLGELILLAALWGASFLFMRVAAPAFGPVALVELRVAIAALCLVPLVLLRGGGTVLRATSLRTGWIGVLNSALPFALLTYATLTLNAGFAAILNATVPLWTGLLAAFWLRERMGTSRWFGMLLGLVGIVIIVWGRIDLKPGGTQWGATLAVGAALLATLCYALAAISTKRTLAQVPPLVTAAGSQVGAALVLLPPALWLWPAQMPAPGLWAAVIALGVLCTALAYILFFRLIAHVGPSRAASVAFLIPVFATLWGGIFLGETLALQTIAGGTVVLLGTALALGLIQWRRTAVAS